MSCRRIQPELAAYLDDELPEAAIEAIRDHVMRCSRCEGDLARLEKVQGAMRTWEAPKVSRDFQTRLAERLGAEASSMAPRDTIPIEVAARAARSGSEREGLREVSRATAHVQESRFARLRRATKWSWIAAATVLVTLGVAKWLDRPEAADFPARPDVSLGWVPATRAEVGDKIHFVLAFDERPQVVAERPDPRQLLFLAAVRRSFAGIEVGDWTLDEDLRREIALLETEATGRPVELGAAPRREPDHWALGLPILGTPAWAEDREAQAGHDPEYFDGLDAYRNGRFLEAARHFDALERKAPGSEASASALAQQVRAVAAAGDFVRGRELVDRLRRDYPLRRKLAAALADRLLEAEANQLVVKIRKGKLLELGTAQARWELAVAQVAAWDLPGAEETLEKGMGGDAFAQDPLAASRAALLLVAIFNWMEEPRAALTVARRLADEGTSPYREIGSVQFAFLDSLEGLDLAGLRGPDWQSIRTLVRFLRASDALRAGDSGVARAEYEELAAEDEGSRLAEWLRRRLEK